MITRRSKYAIRALLVLMQHRDGGALSVDTLAQLEQLPRKFLELIMADLKTAGIVASTRGKRGGYTLLRSPTRITLGQVIRAVDGPIAPAPCASASAYKKCDDCLDETSCALRPVMLDVREAVSRVVDLKTLDTLARETSGRASARAEVGDFNI